MSNFLILLCMFTVSQYYCLNNSLCRGFVCAIHGLSKGSNKAFLYKEFCNVFSSIPFPAHTLVKNEAIGRGGPKVRGEEDLNWC